MTYLADNKDFLLKEDDLENRFWQIYYESSPGTKVKILQENNTNPKINRMGIKQQSDFLQVTETLVSYTCRVILTDALKALLTTSRNYWLSFDNGTTYTKTICVRVEPSREQGLFLTMYLQELK